MSLHACQGCGKRISRKAERCPHCGRTQAGGADAAEAPIPFLISAAEARRRKVKCRECGSEVSVGAGSCPSCGLADPGGRPTRWRWTAVVAIILIAIAAAAAWKLGYLDGRRQNASATPVVDSAALQSGLRSSVRIARRRDPPRIKSARYPAACRSPAPVLVYALERMPATFFVRLAGGILNPELMTDSLVNRYELKSNGYERAWNALYVKNTPPNIVAALRCEAVVNSIEEVAYNEMGDIR